MMRVGEESGPQRELPGQMGFPSSRGVLSTPFPYPHLPAPTAGAAGHGACQAGDCGGAQQPHWGESLWPLPCPGETLPQVPAPAGAKVGGAVWAAGLVGLVPTLQPLGPGV